MYVCVASALCGVAVPTALDPYHHPVVKGIVPVETTGSQ
jgi:hypothetical protein